MFVSRDRVCAVLICEQLMEMIVSGRKEIAKFLDLVKAENCSVVTIVVFCFFSLATEPGR